MKITTAAIRLGKLIVTLPRPYRHPDICMELESLNVAYALIYAGAQGFLTSEGEFVNRRQAFEIAKAAGQLIGHQETNELYSEDIF